MGRAGGGGGTEHWAGAGALRQGRGINQPENADQWGVTPEQDRAYLLPFDRRRHVPQVAVDVQRRRGQVMHDQRRDDDRKAPQECPHHRVRPTRIRQHWEDMLRIVGSFKLGTVHAADLGRSLLKSERPASLAPAMIDRGRINKTVYLLNYIAVEDDRRRRLPPLHRGAGRHKVARTIWHGQRGEIQKASRQGQEDPLHALGLVPTAVVLWNTRYLQAALEQLGTEESEKVE